MKNDITIAGATVAAGESAEIHLNIARLPSRTPIDIPIFVNRSESEGPTVLLMAGLHGDEINGIEIIRRLLHQELHHPLKGTIICVPIINIYGFINFSREVPDGKDVNRSFPGTKKGSLASRVAYHLMTEIIPVIDYGLDFHTGGASRSNFPQIRCVMDDEINRSLAEGFNAPFTIDAPLIPKSLRHAAEARNKKILVYEGGESRRFDEYAIAEGIAGTHKLLHHLEMAERGPRINKRNVVIARKKWIRAKSSGLFHPSVQCGDQVHKKQDLGYITDPYGDFKERLKAPVDGFAIGINHNPVVNQGDALIHLGLPN